MLHVLKQFDKNWKTEQSKASKNLNDTSEQSFFGFNDS
jgi:hypothetical protein